VPVELREWCLRRHGSRAGKDTYRVAKVRDGRRVRRPVRVGAPDASLTGVSGMLAVSELVDRLGVITRLDAAIGSITKRAGVTPGVSW